MPGKRAEYEARDEKDQQQQTRTAAKVTEASSEYLASSLPHFSLILNESHDQNGVGVWRR